MGPAASAGSKNDRVVSLIIKRLFDVLVSIIALVILTAPFLIIAIVIRLDSRGPVFFRQERMGKDARPFTIIKFRTIEVGAETYRMYIESDNPNITTLGHFLRRWGVDELPQLINVVKGQMSIVGPRPIMRYHVEMFDEIEMQRLHVKPGLTGWAQVNGRNKLNWQQKIPLDIWYVRNWSLCLDAKILILTPMALLRKDFAYADDVTKDKFGPTSGGVR